MSSPFVNLFRQYAALCLSVFSDSPPRTSAKAPHIGKGLQSSGTPRRVLAGGENVGPEFKEITSYVPGTFGD
jgi:hypothetical protein